MKMNSMKMKSNMMMAGEAVKEGFSMGKPVPKEEYPYCLRIYLGSDELENLGISKLPALGSEVTIHAKAKVLSQRLDNEDCKTMEIQITDMAMGAGKMKDMAETLYADNEGEDSGTMED